MLKSFKCGKKTCHRTTCRTVLSIPPPTGNVDQGSEPWAKEAGSAPPWGLFSRAGGIWRVLSRLKLVVVKQGFVGKPAGLMGFGNQALPGKAGVLMGTGPLIPQPLDCQRALPPHEE